MVSSHQKHLHHSLVMLRPPSETCKTYLKKTICSCLLFILRLHNPFLKGFKGQSGVKLVQSLTQNIHKYQHLFTKATLCKKFCDFVQLHAKCLPSAFYFRKLSTTTCSLRLTLLWLLAQFLSRFLFLASSIVNVLFGLFTTEYRAGIFLQPVLKEPAQFCNTYLVVCDTVPLSVQPKLHEQVFWARNGTERGTTVPIMSQCTIKMIFKADTLR